MAGHDILTLLQYSFETKMESSLNAPSTVTNGKFLSHFLGSHYHVAISNCWMVFGLIGFGPPAV